MDCLILPLDTMPAISEIGEILNIKIRILPTFYPLYLMNVAVNCSRIEFPQKIIELYFLAIFGNFTLERT